MTLLSRHSFEQRLTGIEARLDRLGRTTTHVSGKRHRKLRIECLAPGVSGLPGLARFKYEERFLGLESGFVRVRYDYDYFDLASGGWRGYHLHALPGGGEPLPHAKCVGADGSGDPDAHYFAYEVDLLAAHDEFEALYASEAVLSCKGLTRID